MFEEYVLKYVDIAILQWLGILFCVSQSAMFSGPDNVDETRIVSRLSANDIKSAEFHGWDTELQGTV